VANARCSNSFNLRFAIDKVAHLVVVIAFNIHLVIAAEIVKAAKIGDNKKLADAEKRWYENADEIAAFLSTINPYWSQNNWKTMLYEHLKMTKSEAVNILTNNYEKSIMDYDEIEKQALKMADIMAEGIARQFL